MSHGSKKERCLKGARVPSDRKEIGRRQARKKEVEDVGRGLNVERRTAVLFLKRLSYIYFFHSSSFLFSSCLLFFSLVLFGSLTPCLALPSTQELCKRECEACSFLILFLASYLSVHRPFSA